MQEPRNANAIPAPAGKSAAPAALSDGVAAPGRLIEGGRLTDALVRSLPVPTKGPRITYDQGPGRIPGFGIRVTPKNARAFVLNYVVAGRERRLTIGTYPAWTLAAAREEVKRLKREVDKGNDPLGERIAEREAPTMSDLCDRFLEEHAEKKRPRTAAEYRRLIERVVRPELGKLKVAEITYTEIDRLHRKRTTTSLRANKTGGAPYSANRLVAVLSKMFTLSILWGMRADNPAKGIERNTEHQRQRYLSGDELPRLTAALAAHPSRQAADAIRLMLLTGARSRREVLSATWDQFEPLAAGAWKRPSSSTKRNDHPIALSAPARLLLVEMRARQQRAGNAPSPYLFPGRFGEGAMVDVGSSWKSICRAAGLRGLRLHDLRHSFASILASAGFSLPVIGALLGHTNPSTTNRYAHLFDDPLRAAADRVGAVVTTAAAATPTAEVVKLGRRSAAR